MQFSPKVLLIVSDTSDTYITVLVRVTLKTTWQDRPQWINYPYKKISRNFESKIALTLFTFISDLRIFAVSQLVELGMQYRHIEFLKNFDQTLHRSMDSNIM